MRRLKSCIYDHAWHEITIEAAQTPGLPGFALVGLASTSIKESTERIKAAFAAMPEFKMPAKKITINLSPSDLPKSGSLMDLPIALLIYMGACSHEALSEDVFVFGELGLSGEIKPTAQLFSLLLFLSLARPGARVIIPQAAAQSASVIPNLRLAAAATLNDAIAILSGSEEFNVRASELSGLLQIGDEQFISAAPLAPGELDFADIRGQERAKTACLIAALGMHNILFEGSPGCGKSMCAKRLASIMPPISLREMLEQNAYRSLNGEALCLSGQRPFRSPHRSSTIGSILGGGARTARIGEIALAHGGVLFFDEFAHFPKAIIESLREPLEDGCINISRVNCKTSYRTDFLFVAAMNPCPCGARFKADLSCTCSPQAIARYKAAISQPILDRIDLYVAMDEPQPAAKASFSTQEARERVLEAFKFAREVRGQKQFSGKLSEGEIALFCPLDEAAKTLLDRATASFALSERARNKIVKVARSVADLSAREQISEGDIRTALGYRRRDEH